MTRRARGPSAIRAQDARGASRVGDERFGQGILCALMGSTTFALMLGLPFAPGVFELAVLFLGIPAMLWWAAGISSFVAWRRRRLHTRAELTLLALSSPR